MCAQVMASQLHKTIVNVTGFGACRLTDYVPNQIAKHGKDITDGDGQALGTMTKGSFNDDYDGGSQSLVRHLAHKHPRPRKERHTRYFGSRGLYATTMYVYLFFAKDGMDESIVNTEAGYKDSSLDHYYWSRGLTHITARLTRRL